MYMNQEQSIRFRDADQSGCCQPCKLACLRKALPCGKNKNMAMRAKTSCFEEWSNRFRIILKFMHAKDFGDSIPHGEWLRKTTKMGSKCVLQTCLPPKGTTMWQKQKHGRASTDKLLRRMQLWISNYVEVHARRRFPRFHPTWEESQ